MMHDIVVEELEKHLSGGGVYQTASRAFYAHIDGCAECRAEVSRMDDLSLMLRELRSGFDAETGLAGAEPVPAPPLGFYSRVRYGILENQPRQGWALFSPGTAFFRRVAFASLLILAGLGSFLVSRESVAPAVAGTDAAAIMAQHDPVAAHTDKSDRDRMLVTLATYHE